MAKKKLDIDKLTKKEKKALEGKFEKMYKISKEGDYKYNVVELSKLYREIFEDVPEIYAQPHMEEELTSDIKKYKLDVYYKDKKVK